MADWRSWLTVALVGLPCVGWIVLVFADARDLLGVREWLRAQWHRLRDPEPATPVDAHADDALKVARSQPWTGGSLPPAIVAGEDLAPSGDPLIADAHALYDAYRAGQDPGGERELSPLSNWTEQGWQPIHDWRLSTDKRWW